MFCLRHPQAEAIFEALRQGPMSPARMEKQFGCGPRAPLLKELQAEGIAVLRPVLKAPRVKSQFDSVVTLTAALRAEYGPELWQRITAKHEQQLLREIFEYGPDGVMRSELLRGANSRAAAGVRAAGGGASAWNCAPGRGDALGSGKRSDAGNRGAEAADGGAGCGGGGADGGGGRAACSSRFCSSA